MHVPPLYSQVTNNPDYFQKQNKGSSLQTYHPTTMTISPLLKAVFGGKLHLTTGPYELIKSNINPLGSWCLYQMAWAANDIFTTLRGTHNIGAQWFFCGDQLVCAGFLHSLN